MAVLLFAACQKEPTPEPQPQPDPTPTISLAGTSWVGTYDDNYRGYPATLTWSLDFLTDSTGILHVDLVIAAQPQASVDDAFTYTFDGESGTITTTDEDGTTTVPFTYNKKENTIVISQKEVDEETGMEMNIEMVFTEEK